jgi:N-carbamoyl-L-amino-acid hydrolase
MIVLAPSRNTTIEPGVDAYAAIAQQLFAEIATRSADGEGVSRPAFSQRETEMLDYLCHYARSEGLSATYDEGRNVVFSLPEDATAERYILVGSHIDSVPHGGNFDGLAGIVAGLICLIRAKREGADFKVPVKVIALRGEESAWFGTCYVGSKALLGRLSDADLGARHRDDGHTLDEHMQAAGINMGAIRRRQAMLDPASLVAYLELHIEQGPVLVEKKLPAAIVSGIRGNFRYRTIRCVGQAGHSGAVPHAYRCDPVLAMSHLLNQLEDHWLSRLQRGLDLVVTSGVVTTDYSTHALSRIADHVDFSLDIRSDDPRVLDEVHAFLMQEIRTLEQERKVHFELSEPLTTAPASCDPFIIDKLAVALRAVKAQPFIMPSGAGHDAAVFADCGVPTGMIFVRNANGSHNPYEAMDVADMMVGTNALYNFLQHSYFLNSASVDDTVNPATQSEKRNPGMFDHLVEILRKNGNGVNAYHYFAQAAQEGAIAHPELAAGYFALGTFAKQFAMMFDGELLTSDIAERQFDRISAYAARLDEGFSGTPDEKLSALNDITKAMLQENDGGISWAAPRLAERL